MLHIPNIHGLLVAALVLGASQPALAIVNGIPTEEYPAVVAVAIDGVQRCTGTLVTKRVVITAAHCVTAASRMSIYIGSGLEAGTSLAVADARHHPGFDPDGLANDIAVLLLEQGASVEPSSIFGGLWDDSFVGRTIKLVGFGAVGPNGGGGVKRIGTAHLRSFDSESLTFTPGPSQTCYGDSGGPAFLEFDGVDVVVGVTSFGDAACTRYGTDIRVDRYVAPFIGPYIAAQSRVGRTVGELCRVDDQCIEQACRAAPGDTTRYCTRPCERDDQCPGTMRCTPVDDGSFCAYDDGGPGALGASCTRNEECGSGICASFDPGGPGECAAWCAPMLEKELCDPSETCRPNYMDEEGSRVCGPPEPFHAGCASTVEPMALWLFVLVFGIHRRRRCYPAPAVAGTRLHHANGISPTCAGTVLEGGRAA